MSKSLLPEFNLTSEQADDLPRFELSGFNLPGFDLPEEILFILDRFEENGKRSYLVGGSVRDLLLGKSINDYDITTSATPQEVKAIFSDYITLDTGLQHGTVTLLIDNKPFEITTFRTDGKYSDHRRPNNVELTTSLFEDSQRRDFTINQIAYNPIDGLVDYHNGLTDLQAKLIRAVGDPYKRFDEDALRIIRAFRFAVQLNFDIENNTFAAVKAMINDLDYVAAERLTHELIKILNSDFLSESKNWQNLMVLWNYLFPTYSCEIYKSFSADLLDNLPQNHNINLTLLAYFLAENDLAHFLNKLKLKRTEFIFVKSYTAALQEIAEVQLSSEKDVDSALITAESSHFSPLDLIELKSKYNLDLQTLIEILNLTVLEPSFGINFQTVEKIKLSFSELLGKQLPLSTLDLAISGKDLIDMGFSQGKVIGQVLNDLLKLVVKGELENSEIALSAAAQTMLS